MSFFFFEHTRRERVKEFCQKFQVIEEIKNTGSEKRRDFRHDGDETNFSTRFTCYESVETVISRKKKRNTRFICRGINIQDYWKEKKKKKMRRRVFVSKVIWKDPEENNEIAEFPYDPEEHVLYFRTSVCCSARTFPPPIKHPSNACRSLNFIFYQTKYKTRAQNISNKLSKRFSLRANEHPADFFFFFHRSKQTLY